MDFVGKQPQGKVRLVMKLGSQKYVVDTREDGILQWTGDLYVTDNTERQPSLTMTLEFAKYLPRWKYE